MSGISTEHDYYSNQSISDHDAFRWPGNASVAVAFVVCLETYELTPPAGAFAPANVPGGFGRAPYPDVRGFSTREYGPRIGIYRVIDSLEKHGIKATAAVDAQTAISYPSLINTIRELNWDVVGHGWAVTQVISSNMSQDFETQHIQSALSALRSAGCASVRGWHGPEYGESSRTPEILVQSGIEYVLDWPNDERPYRMTTESGSIMSLPLLVELDDVYAHWHRKISMDRWARSVLDALDQLEIGGRCGGRMLLLNVHPWLMGQPWRITYFREVIDNISRRKNLWLSTTDDIADWAATQIPR